MSVRPIRTSVPGRQGPCLSCSLLRSWDLEECLAQSRYSDVFVERVGKCVRTEGMILPCSRPNSDLAEIAVTSQLMKNLPPWIEKEKQTSGPLRSTLRPQASVGGVGGWAGGGGHGEDTFFLWLQRTRGLSPGTDSQGTRAARCLRSECLCFIVRAFWPHDLLCFFLFGTN